jgi:hypothetical protein
MYYGNNLIIPATTGVFIYLNIPRSFKNSIQYLAPSPASTAYPEPLSPPKQTSNISPTAKPDTSIFHLYRYIYFLYASTKYFALYPHHGCHLLA